MAWAFVQDLKQVGLDEYDRIAEAVGDEPPEGLMLHVAGRYGDGVRVIDVWESQEAWERFQAGRLREAIESSLGADAMAQGPPPLEGLDVHHLLRGK